VDLAIYRSGSWFIHPASGPDFSTTYGVAGDVPVPADYDGDLRADIAIYRPSLGYWSVHQSSNSADVASTYGGVSGDMPVSADYDRDGKADLAIFRPSGGLWFVRQSTDSADITTSFGVGTDTPLALPYPVRSTQSP
jgi:hypothetical protein